MQVSSGAHSVHPQISGMEPKLLISVCNACVANLPWPFIISCSLYGHYFYKSAASMAVDYIYVRTNGLLEELRLNSVVMSVSTFA